MNDKGASRAKWISLMGLALALKVALMPIGFHPDFIFVQYAPSFLSLHGVVDIYGHFGDHFLKVAGNTYYPPLVYFTIGLFQKIWLPYHAAGTDFFQHLHSLIFPFKVASPADFFAPFPWPSLAGTFFLLKLPYLVLDLLSAALLALLARRESPAGGRGWEAAARWSWDPVVIFSIYIFGQYKMLSTALLFAFLLLLRLGWVRRACFIYGLFCLAENVGVFLLPLVVLAVEVEWKKRLQAAAWMLAAPLAVMLPLLAHSQGYALDTYFSPRLMQAVGARGITNHYLSVVLPVTKAILVLTYLWLAWRLVRRQGPREERYRLVVRTGTAMLLVVYATSITSIHYWLWILPFLCARSAWEAAAPAEGTGPRPPRAFERWGWVAAVVLLFVFNLDSRLMNAGLFMPLAPERLLAWPSFHELMDGWFPWLPWGKCIAAARLSFSAICLALVWPSLRGRLAIPKPL